MGTRSDPTYQWKLCSAQEALLLLIFAAVAIVGLCASATLRKKRITTETTTAEQADGVVEDADKNESIGTKRVVLENGGNSQEEMEIMDDRGGPEGCENTMGLAVWQRRILMGERCQLPKFSGLILYDEHGRPVHNSSNNDTPHQVKETPVVTTLKDLL
ncbi:uncharacterized protein [Elaeis guineensis]|uniref:uncharacterized protein n=1 Tax=Elaeis guineensis var. tenera TaxID=51953 RepID=UPI00057A0FF9